MCESIGHWPLRGSCPAPSLNFNHILLRQDTGTVDHLTLLRLFTFSAFLSFFNSPLLPKCPGDLYHCPCPPTRDWGSRVSGLVQTSLRFLIFQRLVC